jgi:hypothetical protein
MFRYLINKNSIVKHCSINALLLCHGSSFLLLIVVVVLVRGVVREQREASLELLKADEHADVPGAQTQEVRHKTFPKSWQATLLKHLHGAVTQTGVSPCQNKIFLKIFETQLISCFWLSQTGFAWI